MKMHLRTAILAALVAAAAATTSAQTSATTAMQPGPGWSAPKSYTGTIVRVDPAARLVTTRDAGGQTSVSKRHPRWRRRSWPASCLRCGHGHLL